jgi:hypothetical protein
VGVDDAERAAVYYGTAMAGAGAPLRTLMEWMRHADLSTTLRYADYSPGSAASADPASCAAT